MNAMRRPGIAIATNAGLPPTPSTEDGNVWVTGRCWLWCGRETARVTWIGPATVAGGGVSVPLFACEACMRSLGDQIWDTVMRQDAGRAELHGYASVGVSNSYQRTVTESESGGRHRRRK